MHAAKLPQRQKLAQVSDRKLQRADGMRDSTEQNIELPDGITPEVFAEAMKISAERLRSKLPPPPKRVAQQTHRFGQRVVRVRNVIAVLGVLLAMVSLCNCYWPIPKGWAFSILGIGAGFSLPLLLLKEFLSGAGAHVQSQFQQGKVYFREFSFEPSVDTFGKLIALLLIGTLALVLGFAPVYASIIRNDPKAIASGSAGFGSIYFSVVTFATVGFGDIYPVTPLARTAVVAEILLAWGLFGLVFSSLISWITSNIQQMHQQMLSAEEREMQTREAAMKAGGVGLYRGEKGFDELIEEAKKRLESARMSEGSHT